MEDQFSVLPPELVLLIFYLLPSFREIVQFSRTCKRFQPYSNNELVWKRHALSWWESREFSKKTPLEPTVKEVLLDYPEKNWKYFGKCLYFEGRQDGNSTHIKNDYITIGETKNGKLEGWGVDIFKDGTFTTIGYYISGNLNGKGKCIWKSGHCYYGDFQGGFRNGKGKYMFPDGTTYDGSWKNGKKSGFGIFIWENGDRFEGNWENSDRNGFGVTTLASGGEFRGNWKDDEREGFSSMVWPDGFTFQGNFVGGIPEDEEGCIHSIAMTNRI